MVGDWEGKDDHVPFRYNAVKVMLCAVTKYLTRTEH